MIFPYGYINKDEYVTLTARIGKDDPKDHAGAVAVDQKTKIIT